MQFDEQTSLKLNALTSCGSMDVALTIFDKPEIIAVILNE